METPEHVTLGLEIAGIGSRALAALIDVLILVASALSTVILLSMVAGLGEAIGSLGGAVILLLGFVVWNGYFILFEGLRQGQTPGQALRGDPGREETPGARWDSGLPSRGTCCGSPTSFPRPT